MCVCSGTETWKDLLFENSGNGTNKATLIGPAATADVTLTLAAVTDTVAVAGDINALAIALG